MQIRLPHDSDLEQAVLGALMLGARLEDVCLTAGDFHQPSHAVIFMAIAELHHRGEAHDAVTVAAELGRTKRLEDAGGKVALLDCCDMSVSSVHGRTYARQVADLGQRRRLIRLGVDLATKAADADDLRSLVLHARASLGTELELVEETPAAQTQQAAKPIDAARTEG